jgi:hypothetical protein
MKFTVSIEMKELLFLSRSNVKENKNPHLAAT